MHESLPPTLRQWTIAQAQKIGLPGPDDYILLVLRLEKQRQDLGYEEKSGAGGS